MARMSCTICHKEIAEGRDYAIPPPADHVYYGWGTRIVVCYPCQQEYYARIMREAVEKAK